MASSTGAARPAAGHNKIPIAKDRNPESAHTRIRKKLNAILYPGTLTRRLKRYAAEPAPDRANLTPIDERTANTALEITRQAGPTRRWIRGADAGMDRPIVRQSRTGSPDRPRHNCRAAHVPASGRSRTAGPRPER